jgi:YYY domain-containing protein
MLSFIYWYLLITLLGMLAFPLAYKLLPGLADRGYTLARTLGLLIWGYLFWLLGSLGVLENSAAAEVFALTILAAFGYLAWCSLDKIELFNWLRQQRRMVIVVEALFLLAFMGWSIVRSANPEIVGTEKPMELAFVNALLSSPTLPPHDPWLSGHDISYYYFGYVMVAMLARLTGTLGGVAFNLGISLVFALTAIGAYGVLYNMLNVRREREDDSKAAGFSFSALIAPLFVLIISNLSGLLQLMRVYGVFWRKTVEGQWVSPFWAWLDIGSLSTPPTETSFKHWWWWQGSRIVQDYDYLWNKKEGVIDEFPFFSFLLADLHAHVMALPFGFMAMALALNLLSARCLGQMRCYWIRLDLDLLSYGFAAFVLGALGFLNAWDFPFYVALFAGAYVIKRLHDSNQADTGHEFSLAKSAKEFIAMGVSLGVIGGLAFLPFYQGFSSQAGGLVPNLIYITKGVYEWIMFAPLLLPIFGLLIYLWRLYGDRRRFITGVKASLVLLAMLLVVTAALTALLAGGTVLEKVNPQASFETSAFLGSLQAPGFQELISEGIARRLQTPGTLLTLMPILIIVFALLWPWRSALSVKDDVQMPSTGQTFALLLILLGAVLVLIPEFVYLRDFFRFRINTIFKLYYLAWVVWSVAAAYGMVVVWRKVTGFPGITFKTISITLLIVALLYPGMALWTKTNGFNPRQWELDGTAYLMRHNPDEAAAIKWLQEAPLGIVAESVGSSYSDHARISTHSGHPAVLGWVGHERQWRGGVEQIGSREDDIARLYCSRSWQDLRAILNRYDIRYVVIGELERKIYEPASRSCAAGLDEAIFAQYLTLSFKQGKVSIYEAP